MNSLTLTHSPALDYSAIDRAPLQPSTRTKYKRAIEHMVGSGVNPLDFPALQSYADGLSHSSRAFLKAALKVMTQGALTQAKGSATPQNIQAIQALIARVEAMQDTIQVHTPAGTKAHTWLSREQVEEITALPDRTTTRGMRDYIVLAVALGAGLRRDELVNLTFDCLRQQPAKNGLRDVLSITGKGGKRRVVPISPRLAYHLREWHKLAGDGYVMRSINKAGTVNGSLSPIGIHNIVRKYGALIGLPELDAHDLRRTFARLGYDAGVTVEQISRLLGHADVRTTMRYLGIEIDLEQTVSDFVPISGD